MGGVFAERVVKGTFVVILKGWFEIRMSTIFDDDPGPLCWREAPEVSKALLGDQDLNIMFCMVNMGYHGYNAGNLTILGL